MNSKQAVLALAAAVMVLGGCGGGSDTPSPSPAPTTGAAASDSATPVPSATSPASSDTATATADRETVAEFCRSLRDHQEPVLAAAQELGRNRSGRGLDADTYRAALAKVQAAEDRAPEELRPYLSSEREVLDDITQGLANRDPRALRKVDVGRLQEASGQLVVRCRTAG